MQMAADAPQAAKAPTRRRALAVQKQHAQQGFVPGYGQEALFILGQQPQ